MKRLIILLLSVAFMIKMNAQTEIYVNIGLFPQGHIPSPTTELQTSTTALSSTESKQIINNYHTPNGHPAFTIGVLRPIIPNLSIGVQYSYFTSSAFANSNIIFHPMASSDSELKIKVGDVLKADSKNHVILAIANFNWLKKGKLSLYSKIGAGIRISNSTLKVTDKLYDADLIGLKDPASLSKSYFAYQITPLGVDYKIIKFLSIFAEGGYGDTGCINAGIKASF